MLNRNDIRLCLDKMGEMYPDAHCELNHKNPFELVIAVLLSAQCTDVSKISVSRRLFECFS